MTQAGISQKRLAVREWPTFAVANHFCLTPRRIVVRSPLPGWSIIARALGSWGHGWTCYKRIAEGFQVKSDGGFANWSAMNIDGRPSVAFLIPFASRRTKSRWNIACAHLRQTLKSVQNSTSRQHCVVVGGHEAPDFNIETNTKVCFLSLDHDIPHHQNAVVSGRLDKLAKIAAAWNYAKSRWNPHYLMKLDADDLISSKLVHWLENFGGEPGYLIKHGWVWRLGARHVFQGTEYLDRVCASCLIIRSDIADQEGPFRTGVEGAHLDEASLSFAATDQYSLVPGSGTSTLLLNDSHQRCAAQFAYLGHKISTVPFKAVVYRTGNPESNSAALKTDRPTLRMRLGAIRRTRLITNSLRKEFALG